MGKKKKKTETQTALDNKETKSQKSYSYAADPKSKVAAKPDEEENLIKVQIPVKLEAAILDLILESKRKQQMSGSASFRLTSKKLTDMYMSLTQTGFKHSQIEAAMSNTVVYGGDLMDTLDWLCLNTSNDQLPGGFSQTLNQEGHKNRPRFQQPEPKLQAPPTTAPIGQQAAGGGAAANKSKSVEKPKESMKSWILQYADQDSESDSELYLDDRGSKKPDPNSKYLELTTLLLDARGDASLAKDSGDKAKAKEIGKQIRKYIQEMDALEKEPGFNPSVKVKNLDLDIKEPEPEVTSPVTMAASAPPKQEQEVREKGKQEVLLDPEEEEEDGDMLGFGLMEEQVVAEKPKEKKSVQKPKYDKRSFAYTRQQWTGKSPKQFLIDWIRKHEPKSPPPSFKQVKVLGNLWKSKVKVVQKDGVLEVMPEDIVCENVKEAEHLAAMLALYSLCKGQRVYQLLPPPYRDVWLEWQDAEDTAKHNEKVEENKPRDQFISRLMKKLKVDGGPDSPTDSPHSDSDSVGETWEDLKSDEDSKIAKTAPRYTGPSLERLQRILKTNQLSQKYQDLHRVREQLPVYGYRDKILSVVNAQNVVVIAGETGSGKSTQIPHFLLEDLLERRPGHIICTQPRRISAISLANRVADELGEKAPGRSDGLCGYQIRFESKKSETTSLVYCTTGVVLRKLQQDPELKGVTHIIVDEVHERSVQSDFLLIILRELLTKRPDLHIVLMSATLDALKFSSYFQHCPVIEIPGRTFPVEVFHVEDVVEMTSYTLESDSPYCLREDQLVKEEQATVAISGKHGDSSKVNLNWTKDHLSGIDRSDLDPGKYSHKTRNTVTRLRPDKVNTELIMELIAFLDTDSSFSSMNGAILVFLPGLVHIQDLYDGLKSDRKFADEKRYKIIALHSVLSSEDQGAAFTVPPPGTRKIVIATNIAETGITIPDVVFVIDSGKVKENRYIETTQLSSLEEVFVSQASAKQRQGRAGRVQEGICFRLYTHHKYQSLKKYSVPEMLRVPLEELCLHIMKCDMGNPADFLARALDPPQPLAVGRAMSILREVGACDLLTPDLTPLGHHLAALPVNVRIGKMLIYSAIFGCLEPMAVVAASITEKSPFAAPIGRRDQADIAKQSLSTENSDHLTLLRAYLMWKETRAKGYRAEIEFCQKFYLKRNSLVEINNIAQDLIKLVKSSGFTNTKHSKLSSKSDQSAHGILFTAEQLSSKTAAILKAVLLAGLYPNIAEVTHTPKVDSAANPEKQICVTNTPQGPIQIHPASVNRFLGANGWVTFHEKIKLGRPYLRDTSLITSYPLLLFGGEIDVQHKDQIVTIDDWIRLKAYAKTAVIFKELRKLINNLLAQKLKKPDTAVHDDPVVLVIMDLVTSDRR